MKNRILIFIILLSAIIISFCGCTDNETIKSTGLITVNTTDEIYEALETGPTLIMIGAVSGPFVCPACVDIKPVVQELATEYSGQVKFIYIDTNLQQKLASQFYVIQPQPIPAFYILLKSENGSIIYVTRNGETTKKLSEAMLVSYYSLPEPVDKNLLEVTIQHALRLRGQN